MIRETRAVALHVSGLSQTVSLALPHAVPEGSNASAGHAPAPLQFSATSQAPASARHTTVVGSLFATQVPDALHVSGLSQTVSLALHTPCPQARMRRRDMRRRVAILRDVAGAGIGTTHHRRRLVVHDTGTRRIARVRIVATVSLALPHAVPAGSNASAGHAPAPSQFSATSQAPASARHKTVVGSTLLRQLPLAFARIRVVASSVGVVAARGTRRLERARRTVARSVARFCYVTLARVGAAHDRRRLVIRETRAGSVTRIRIVADRVARASARGAGRLERIGRACARAVALLRDIARARIRAAHDRGQLVIQVTRAASVARIRVVAHALAGIAT
jgi:hypothetical protein